MKISQIAMFKKSWLILTSLVMLFMISCEKEEPPVDTDNPIASFQFEVDGTNFLQVAFTNFSQNASDYSWDFGDGNTSTDESPTHTYAAGGSYEVVLTATKGSESAQRSETIMITDPNSQLALLAGAESKTWYLQREGIALGIGPELDDNAWWSFGGVTPLADRPCILDDSYTFNRDGSFTFESAGSIFVDATANGGWIINGEDQEGCYDDTDPATWGDNADRSAFASGGDYTYEYDNANGTIVLNGLGAFIGLANKTNAGDNAAPIQMKTYTITTLSEGPIADSLHMHLLGDGYSWNFYLVSYKDINDLPEIPTDVPPFGVDLPDASPSSLTNTFMEAGTASLDTIVSGSTAEYGVTDPADASLTCGQFNRTDLQFQELKFQTSPDKNDINFENLTTVSIDVYMPSSNDYSGALENKVIIGFADQSATAQWWTDQMEYTTADPLPLDEWTTITYNLSDAPTYVADPDKAMNPYGRNDYDMIYVQIGGGNHTETGTFYVRNLRFE